MTLRVLLLDDGEVPTAAICEALRSAGAEVVRLRDLFEAQALLDSHRFDVLIGHEIFLLVAAELKVASRRLLLTSCPHEWTPAQLEYLGVSGVVAESTDPAELLRVVGA